MKRGIRFKEVLLYTHTNYITLREARQFLFEYSGDKTTPLEKKSWLHARVGMATKRR